MSLLLSDMVNRVFGVDALLDPRLVGVRLGVVFLPDFFGEGLVTMFAMPSAISSTSSDGSTSPEMILLYVLLKERIRDRLPQVTKSQKDLPIMGRVFLLLLSQPTDLVAERPVALRVRLLRTVQVRIGRKDFARGSLT